MSDRRTWILLAYRIPREPSTPRISVWRKLRQLGAAQIVDGLVALPSDRRTREQFEWLAQEVREASGDAWLWESRLTDAARERSLIAEMKREAADEYRHLAAAARLARDEEPPARRRVLLRLRRELRRIASRDYFGAGERAVASAAIERLSATLEGIAR